MPHEEYVEKYCSYKSLDELNLDINDIDNGECLDEYIIVNTDPIVTGEIDRVPSYFFTKPMYSIYLMLQYFDENKRSDVQYTDLCLEGIEFLRKKLKLSDERKKVKRAEK